MDELKPNGSAQRLGTALQAVIREANNGLETRVTGIETRVTGIETRVTGIETRVTGIETRVTGIEEVLKQHGYSLERIEKALTHRGHLSDR